VGTGAIINSQNFFETPNLPTYEIMSNTAEPKILNLSDPFFTLKAVTNEQEDSARIKLLESLKVDLAQIGIELDIEELTWPDFVEQLIVLRDFDMCYVALTGNPFDPDMTGVYDENGSLNLFGYHTSMDWEEELGTGLNEWYMDEGRVMMPPQSMERINHYKDWQQYLMDDILPLIPGFSRNTYESLWSQLSGYDSEKGLMQSWGNMYWEDLHTGQTSASEIVIGDTSWQELNPLFSDNQAEADIYNAIMDPLIWFDSDASAWPHIIEDRVHFNDTHLRLFIRQGIQWQDDPDGFFFNEYLNAKDVYFTLFAQKHLGVSSNQFEWIDEMTLVDDYTLDLFIDGDPYTEENEPFNYLKSLNTPVLPEHYLNQSQLGDGVTPDISHVSWSDFSINPFGTGLFELSSYTEGIETELSRFENCWRMDSTITVDPNLDWISRFGDLWMLDTLRVRIIEDLNEQMWEFDEGRLDILNLLDESLDRKQEYEDNWVFNVQSKTTSHFGFYGFNMREIRGTPMQNRDPCIGDPTLSQGLAIRKAIAFATNKEAKNNAVYDGEYNIVDHPIFPSLGIWLNDEIIKYDFDLETAKYYMALAGFDLDLDSDGDGFTDFRELNVYKTDPYNMNSLPPGPFFSLTILCPDTNPYRMEYALLFAQELPKIGVIVEDLVFTGWDEISPRTWSNPGPYPILSHDEGGYDMLFVGWGWGYDWNPTGLYDIPSIVPNGDNFYQYENSYYDQVLSDLTNEIDIGNRINLAHEMQSILYNDLPSIPIVYSKDVYVIDSNLQNYDFTNWGLEQSNMEQWLIPSVTELHYGIPAYFEDFFIGNTDNVFDRMWLRQIYDGLLYREPYTGLVAPKLCVDYYTTDLLTYHFSLNPAATWADGTPMTAYDVEYSYDYYLLYDGYTSQYVQEVNVLSAYELEIVFNSVNTFAESTIFTKKIFPQHIWSVYPYEELSYRAADFAISEPWNIFGTGPYRLTSFNHFADEIILSKNTNYGWSPTGPAYFDDISFRHYNSKEDALNDLEAGILDVIDASFQCEIDEITDRGLAYDTALSGTMQELGLNQMNPYYGTGDLCPIAGAESANYVRKAFSCLFDRVGYVNDIYNGKAQVATTHYPDFSIQHNDALDPIYYDLDLAIYYMELAGFDMTTLADSDGDGLSDEDEINIYFTDPYDSDTDDDGLDDYEEVFLEGDGFITDPNDPDTDGDELNDYDEWTYGTDPTNPDTDGDGYPDGLEVANGWDPLDPNDPPPIIDTDQDGLEDDLEVLLGTDPANPDTDGDGLRDGEEFYSYKTNPKLADTDSDGINDGMEVLVFNTNPLLADTDGDILDDWVEIYETATDPNNPDTDGDTLKDGYEVLIYNTNPLLADSDWDGLTDFEEIFTYGTEPLNSDTDGDGVSDGDELTLYFTDPFSMYSDGDTFSDYDEIFIYGTNPNLMDSDGDGLGDVEEVTTFNTDPNDADTDDDGYSDKWEIDNGFDPLDGTDTIADDDFDGLTSVEEDLYGTDPDKYDTDGDLLSDYDEIFVYGTNPLSDDTDGDDVSDWEEVIIHSTNPFSIDTDGDFLTDSEEISEYYTDPLNDDSDGDGLLDGTEVLYYQTDPLLFDTDDDGFSDGEEISAGTDPLDDKSYPGSKNDQESLNENSILTNSPATISIIIFSVIVTTAVVVITFIKFRVHK